MLLILACRRLRQEVDQEFQTRLGDNIETQKKKKNHKPVTP